MFIGSYRVRHSPWAGPFSLSPPVSDQTRPFYCARTSYDQADTNPHSVTLVNPRGEGPLTAYHSMVYSATGRHASFTVLAVCTANVYRSPLIEHCLRDATDRLGLRWRVASAGVEADGGARMEPRVSSFLRSHSIEPLPDWRNRRLIVADIEQSDLILTATEDQRAAVARIAPTAIHYTLPLLQFTRLVSAASLDPSTASGPELVAEALATRARVQNGNHDVPDPSRHTRRTFPRSAAQIYTAITVLTADRSQSGRRARRI